MSMEADSPSSPEKEKHGEIERQTGVAPSSPPSTSPRLSPSPNRDYRAINKVGSACSLSDRFIPQRLSSSRRQKIRNVCFRKSLFSPTTRPSLFTTTNFDRATVRYRQALHETLLVDFQSPSQLFSYRPPPHSSTPCPLTTRSADEFPNRRSVPTVSRCLRSVRTLEAPKFARDYHGDHLAWFDRKMVVVLGGSVYMWDSVNKRIDTVYSTERPARYRGISSNSESEPWSVKWVNEYQLAIGMRSQRLLILDPNTGQSRFQFGNESPVAGHCNSMASYPFSENVIVSGWENGTVVGFDTRASPQRPVMTLNTSSSASNTSGQSERRHVNSLKFSDDGYLASVDDCGMLNIWQFPMTSTCNGASNPVTSTTVSKGPLKALSWVRQRGRFAVVTGSMKEGEICFWSRSSGACYSRHGIGDAIFQIAYNKDWRELALCTGGANLPHLGYSSLWNIRASPASPGSDATQLELISRLRGHMDIPTCLTARPDGSGYASGSSGRDQTLRLFDVWPRDDGYERSKLARRKRSELEFTLR